MECQMLANLNGSGNSMIFLSKPSVYLLPGTWESPGVDYPFPTITAISCLVALGLVTWFVTLYKNKKA